MIFVCLSHFTWSYHELAGHDALARWLATIGALAPPSFILISGTMLGYLYRRASGKFAEIRLRAIDRALFLLTVGHILVFAAHLPQPEVAVSPFRLQFFTDSIAISTLVAVWLLTWMRLKSRLLLAGLSFAAGWALLVPFGLTSLPGELPWLALFLVGTLLGEALASESEGSAGLRFELLLRRLGVVAVVAGLSLRLLSMLLTRGEIVAAPLVGQGLEVLTSPWQKVPPSPVYALLFGGTSLVIASVPFTLERRNLASPFLTWTALLGRNSLFVFIAQYYVYYVALFYLRPDWSPWWPIFFVATLALLTIVTKLWADHGLNRWTTVGLPRLARALGEPRTRTRAHARRTAGSRNR
jgi:hypothetical protein